MRRFLLLLSIIFLIGFSWSFVEGKMNLDKLTTIIQKGKEDFHTFIESGELEEITSNFMATVQSLLGKIKDEVESPPDITFPNVEKPELITPTEQAFSVYNIQIGDSKQEVEGILGKPQRVSYNEYGLNWSTYHQNYQNYVQVMYNDKEQVVGLYTNQDMIASIEGIALETPKEKVLSELGVPLTKIQKGFVYYQFQEETDYDIFQLDDSYITIFYDKHENNTVTAIQIIHKNIEQQKKEFYTKASEKLKEGFEYQMFDLTNATRVNHQLNILTWDEHVKETARDHSMDMAVNNYFDHTNLEGESPFDRMQDDNINFSVAGENLAYGQFSSIFAHEGLMNSLGHRKNILQSDFQYLGVGVAFNDESHPYYTQNYYSK